MLFFLGTTTLAILSLHTGVFWMAIEATTLASAPMISYQRSSRSLEAAWKYLLICSVGIAIALVGNTALAVSIAFHPATYGLPLTFRGLAAHAASLHPVWLKVAVAFIRVGYGTKMGLAPMHTWLPDAHSEAPSPVSALLSGALLNCAFLGILRTNAILVRAGIGDYSNGLLIAFGLGSMFLAGWFILQQADFKRLLAYSSIEHMGILAIAAGAGLTILPEQQGNWGYAQQEMDDETAVFTLATGILGRLYLSGFIDRMDEHRLALVRDAVALHRRVLTEQQELVPFWPARLPDFDGDWLVVGLRHPSFLPSEDDDPCDYIIVWRRGGTPSVNVPLSEDCHIEQIFPNPAVPEHAPDAKPWTVERMDPETVRLNAATSKQPSARIFAIRRA